MVSMIAFVAAIALTIVARRWFTSKNSDEVKLGALVLSALGGPQNARQVRSQMQRRNLK
jgi:hypothetical protein